MCICAPAHCFSFVHAPYPRHPPNHRYTEFSGFHGVIGGLVVALKQVMSDQEIKLAGLPPLRAKVRGHALHGWRF